MKRRGFLKDMLLAAIAPTIIANLSVDRFKWKPTKDGVFIPTYENAPYEMFLVYNPQALIGDHCWLSRQPINPVRFHKGKNGYIPFYANTR